MSLYAVNGEDLIHIANAIREKTDSEAPMKISEMADNIKSIVSKEEKSLTIEYRLTEDFTTQSTVALEKMVTSEIDAYFEEIMGKRGSFKPTMAYQFLLEMTSDVEPKVDEYNSYCSLVTVRTSGNNTISPTGAPILSYIGSNGAVKGGTPGELYVIRPTLGTENSGGHIGFYITINARVNSSAPTKIIRAGLYTFKFTFLAEREIK